MPHHLCRRDSSFAEVKGAVAPAAIASKSQKLLYTTSSQSSSSSVSNAAAATPLTANIRSSGENASAGAGGRVKQLQTKPSTATQQLSSTAKAGTVATPQLNRASSPTSHAGALRGCRFMPRVALRLIFGSGASVAKSTGLFVSIHRPMFHLTLCSCFLPISFYSTATQTLSNDPFLRPGERNKLLFLFRAAPLL